MTIKYRAILQKLVGQNFNAHFFRFLKFFKSYKEKDSVEVLTSECFTVFGCACLIQL